MLSEECLAGTAVVIGAGTMGRGIAAQIANAGWRVHLLDTTLEAAQAGLERLQSSTPPLLFLPEFAARVRPGGLSENLDVLRAADWVVEAAYEDRTVKQTLMAKIEAHAGPETLVSSNTSGLSLHEMTATRSPAFRRRFLGTHFLNPPRYLKLLEVIPLPETDLERLLGFARFAEQILGHRVVRARDTPGFISTRIGIWHLLDSLHTALEMGLTPEEADYVTGPLLGRPRTGTFRLADVIGLDILAAIGRDLFARLPDDPNRDRFQVPGFVESLLAEGRTGDKSGAGFYKRDGKQLLTLDLNTLDYRPRQDVRSVRVEDLLRLPLRERLPLLGRNEIPGGAFANSILDSLTEHVRQVGPEIADDGLSLDQTMRWGFGWEMGPCEIDLLLLPSDLADIPKYRNFVKLDYKNNSVAEEFRRVADYKPLGALFDTPEASFIDIGDGVACLEFHSKMNTFSPALTACVDQARKRAERDFQALVIANDAKHFSAGYNLYLFLRAAEAEDWAGLDAMLRQIQSAFLGLKYARIPVVAAPHGYTLGAGCECVLHCAGVAAAPELALGLPELTVGVIPAGGGTTQMFLRAVNAAGTSGEVFSRVERVFDLLARPRNSANAYDAQQLGLVRPSDTIVHNADRQLYEAKRQALALARTDYQPPSRRTIHARGEETLVRLRIRSDAWHQSGQMTEHDRLIADKIAFVLSGGDLPAAREVSEETLLALERQAFLELMHEPKTLARMRHVLETGKPLQN